MESNNSEVLKDFIKYCEAAPELRFWQALRNWSGFNYIYAAKEESDIIDTFYFVVKNPFKHEHK